MSERILVNGNPVPDDDSHTAIDPFTGMQRSYVVLSPAERAKGFVKPLRDGYVHDKCGAQTFMGKSIAETYARDPHFYSGTFCVLCKAHFPLSEFYWLDGEPMDPRLQEAWNRQAAERRKRQQEEWRQRRIVELRRELAELESE